MLVAFHDRTPGSRRMTAAAIHQYSIQTHTVRNLPELSNMGLDVCRKSKAAAMLVRVSIETRLETVGRPPAGGLCGVGLVFSAIVAALSRIGEEYGTWLSIFAKSSSSRPNAIVLLTAD